MSSELATVRQQIDLLDDQLVPLLAQRIELALSAGRHKQTVEEIRGCDRVSEVLDKVAERTRRVNGDELTVVGIYRHIIESLTTLQLREKGLGKS